MLHNSHDSFYRFPLGPVPIGGHVRIRFRCDDAKYVFLRTWMGEEHAHPMTSDEKGVWETSIDLPKDQAGLFWYDFVIIGDHEQIIHYGNREDNLGGEGQVFEHGLHSYQITVYDPAYRTPEFIHGANIYQIFPDRFFRAPSASVDDEHPERIIHENWDDELFSNHYAREEDRISLDYFGGTLNGIASKLQYLKDMGVDVIYLNPIFKSHANHHYDTGDYETVDPLLGTNDELTALTQKAKDLGIHIILDGVFSHTGDDSRYFNRYSHYDTVGAYQGKQSPYYEWYTFTKYPTQYRSWWGFKTLPEVQKNNLSYQNYMFADKEGIVPRWIHAGTSGWRLDVADELPMDFLRKLRVSVKKADPEAVVLGEVWEDASNKVAYGETRCYCSGDTLDSVMNYPLRLAILDFLTGKSTAHDLVRLVKHQQEVYPAPFLYSLMNLMGSHDRARALNALVNKEGRELNREQQKKLRLTPDEYVLATARYRKAIDLLCALPGCPTVYYGDEIGMTGAPDPYCRRPYAWGHADDNLRTYVAAKLNHHRDSDVLRYGHCEIEAIDDDTVRIRRYLNGTDALGAPAAFGKEEICTVKR